jgi:O-antigen/teichoic acid export membrane protein
MNQLERLRTLFGHTISQNVIANAIRTFLQIVIAFVGNYFLVRIATKEELGIWALVFVFANFLNLADLGVSTALIRYIANDEKKRPDYFWTVIWFYSFVGIVGIGILFIVKSIFGEIFFKDINPSITFLLLTIIGTYFSLLCSVVTNTFNGLQMMKRSSLVEVCKSFVHYFFILSLFSKIGVLAFGVGFLMSNVLSLLLGIFLLFSVNPLPFKFFKIETFKHLFVFGSKSFGIQLINQIKGAWLKLLTSNLFTIEHVAYVDLTEKIIGYFRQMLLSVILPLMPAASSYHAKNQTDKLRKLYKTSLQAILGFGVIATGVFIATVPTFIKFWLGLGFEPVVFASQLISLAVFFNLVTGPGYSVLQGIGRQKPLLINAVFGLISFLVFTSLFARS